MYFYNVILMPTVLLLRGKLVIWAGKPILRESNWMAEPVLQQVILIKWYYFY